ncbi:GHKL domain-containing protein [Rouxiella sp. S1S-2]|uniref:ATP-binding protein n=1 Tax=Rouxiella sp. S1S-2 TaxID=2653856 RepID=UPI001265A8DC|nr:ATP-binding protein [Rouxiella sp. S1S-2]KAB7895720.1 GHKL domain-containing protein [Rouxiella sp. S1S-2]
MKMEAKVESSTRSRRNMKLFFVLYFLMLIIIIFLSYYIARCKLEAQTSIIKTSLTQAGNELTLNINRYEFIPFALSLDDNIKQFLIDEHSDALKEKVHAQLVSIRHRVGALDIFIVDSDGMIVSSSDAPSPHTLVGHNVQFRPYFQNVKEGDTEHFYGVGTTDSIPGYYQAHGIYAKGKKQGVVAVKIDVDTLLTPHSGYGDKVFLYDDNKVIVNSKDSGLLYHSLISLNGTQQEELLKTHRYNNKNILPADVIVKRKVSDQIYDVLYQGKHYIQVDSYLPPLNLTLAQLSPINSLLFNASLYAAFGFFITTLVFIAILIFRQKQQITRLKLERQKMLEDANINLDRLVKERSHELEIKNESLAQQVKERIHSERKLRSMQNELIRSEKLAVIGQLSAGLAHEINQPLSALSVLSENSVRFLELGQIDEVKSNLNRVIKLVQFIGRLSNQLRSFSRNSDDSTSPVSISASLDNAMVLLAHRFKLGKISFVRVPPESEVRCLCNNIRLEQVLVNIINNSLDAMEGTDGECFIHAHWYDERSHAVIKIEDNGPGIPHAIIGNIFEPFFTTKKSSGLGLGLAISADIINSFNGKLSVEQLEKGTCFTITLPLHTVD